MTDAQHFPILGVSACVWRGDRVLMIQRAKPPVGLWVLPGGHVEPGETVIAAAHRELLEETGVSSDLSHFVGLYDIIRRGGDGELAAHFVIACYGGLWTGGEALGASDAGAARWMTRDEVLSAAAPETVAAAVTRMANILGL